MDLNTDGLYSHCICHILSSGSQPKQEDKVRQHLWGRQLMLSTECVCVRVCACVCVCPPCAFT